MEVPETRYARSGDVSIAYQVLGEGPFDLVRIPPFVSHVELAWQIPSLAAFYSQLASFSRLITFDKRGTGMSDRVSGAPSLEERMDDVRAVMDAAGSEQAALLGVSEGGAMSVLFAATYPERAWALVLDGSSARSLWAPDYPWASTEDQWLRFIDERARSWGTPEYVRSAVERLAPSASAEDRAALGVMIRQSASPGAAVALSRMNMQIDVRHVLPAVRVPTLVVNRIDDGVAAGSRYLAEHIPGSRHLELPGSDHAEFVGDCKPFMEEIEPFLAQAWESRVTAAVEPDRVLATVLFTDIVDSTAKAVTLGDAGWRELVQAHHGLVRRQLARYRGSEIDTAGDGFFASGDARGDMGDGSARAALAPSVAGRPGVTEWWGRVERFAGTPRDCPRESTGDGGARRAQGAAARYSADPRATTAATTRISALVTRSTSPRTLKAHGSSSSRAQITGRSRNRSCSARSRSS